ncbi:hypothetical protein RFI_37893, partial [Reticulomyxa filosa]
MGNQCTISLMDWTAKNQNLRIYAKDGIPKGVKIECNNASQECSNTYLSCANSNECRMQAESKQWSCVAQSGSGCSKASTSTIGIEEESNSMSIGVIAGASAVGVLLMIGLVLYVGRYLWKKRQVDLQQRFQNYRAEMRNAQNATGTTAAAITTTTTTTTTTITTDTNATG